jgi:hypothetical protein
MAMIHTIEFENGVLAALDAVGNLGNDRYNCDLHHTEV